MDLLSDTALYCPWSKNKFSHFGNHSSPPFLVHNESNAENGDSQHIHENQFQREIHCVEIV